MAQLLIRDVVILISSFGSAIAFPDFLHFVSAYIGDLRINLRARDRSMGKYTFGEVFSKAFESFYRNLFPFRRFLQWGDDI